MIDRTARTPPGAEQEHAARWEDYIDVFFSPVELFRRRARDSLAPPLLTLLALSLVFYFVLLPANRAIMRAALAQNPQAAEAAARLETVFLVIGSFMVPLTYLVVIGWAAFLLWIVGRFAEIRTDFSRTMLIATYAGFVYLLASIVNLVLVLLQGGDVDVVRDVSFGVLRFVGSSDMHRVARVLLGRLDLFVLWMAALWAIGLRVSYSISTARASLVAGVAWLLYAVPGLLTALLGIGSRSPGA